jgi:DNA-binding transcriptional regulator YbjK
MSEINVVRRQRRTKAEQRAETLEQIVDAAEHLFSKNGLHGVTLRDVGMTCCRIFGPEVA